MNINTESINSAQWKREEEDLLASWAERAAGYAWMHSQSSKLYTTRANRIGVPAVVLSIVAGSAVFSTINSNEDAQYNTEMKVGIGAINLLTAVLSGLRNFLNYDTFAETHRNSSVQFSSFYRIISAELTLPPSDRVNPKDFIKTTRIQYDKLVETAQIIPSSIVNNFNRIFKHVQISKPEVCNGIHKVIPYGQKMNTSTDYILTRAFYLWALRSLRENKNLTDLQNKNADELKSVLMTTLKHNSENKHQTSRELSDDVDEINSNKLDTINIKII
jgi:hypothetical protein